MATTQSYVNTTSVITTTFLVNNITLNVNSSTRIVYPQALSHFAAFMAILFVILGCLGNGTTIVALLFSEKLRKHATTMFVISLAVTDCIYCAFNLPLTASRSVHSSLQQQSPTLIRISKLFLLLAKSISKLVCMLNLPSDVAIFVLYRGYCIN